jgi:hypothetical protein
VDGPAVALNGLTPRRALFLILALMFAAAFAQIAPAEFLWIMAGDAATWLEIAAAAWLLTASRVTSRMLKETAAKVVVLTARLARPTGRMRDRRAARRMRPPNSDENPTSPWAYA